MFALSNRGLQGLDLAQKEKLWIIHGKLASSFICSTSPAMSESIFIEWPSISDHEAFMADTDTYQKLLATVNEYMADLSMFHVRFLHDPLPAFRSPIVEITIITSEDANNDSVRSLIDVLNGESVASGSRRNATYGRVVEDSGRVVVVCGWDSLEVSHSSEFGHSIWLREIWR